MTERVRFTISVEQEVYEAFADLAHTSGVSMSRCIGDWLRDTAEAAQMTTVKLNEVRRSPQDALQAFLLSLQPDMADIAEAQRIARDAGSSFADARAVRKRRLGDLSGAQALRSDPPPSNTGGKGQHATGTRGQKS